jgi:hypothetical protein
MNTTIKEQIVDALRDAGYDFMTACEHATKKLAELRAAPLGEYTFCAGSKQFTVRKS